MQVFRAALKIFFKHPFYIAIFVLAVSLLGVSFSQSVGNYETKQGELAVERPYIGIIDRDNSELSTGLVSFLDEQAELIELEDSRRAMQDALAQDTVYSIVIIPEGFEQNFMRAARENTSPPTIDTATGYASVAAVLVDGLVNEYLNTVRLYVISDTAKNPAEIVVLSFEDMKKSGTITLVQFGELVSPSLKWRSYMSFSGYTIVLSIMVCVGVMLSAFNRVDIRKRNLGAPVSNLSRNLQLALACFVAALVPFVVVSLLGLIIFGSSLVGTSLIVVGLLLLNLLILAVVSLALAFLVGQITTSELMLNAVGNIVGLLFSFLGGIFVAIELLGSTVTKIAYFVPSFYYGDVITRAGNLHDYSSASLAPIFANMGIMLLFAAALFAVALVIGRLRMQSAEAGGNAAATRTRS